MPDVLDRHVRADVGQDPAVAVDDSHVADPRVRRVGEVDRVVARLNVVDGVLVVEELEPDPLDADFGDRLPRRDRRCPCRAEVVEEGLLDRDPVAVDRQDRHLLTCERRGRALPMPLADGQIVRMASVEIVKEGRLPPLPVEPVDLDDLAGLDTRAASGGELVGAARPHETSRQGGGLAIVADEVRLATAARRVGPDEPAGPRVERERLVDAAVALPLALVVGEEVLRQFGRHVGCLDFGERLREVERRATLARTGALEHEVAPLDGEHAGQDQPAGREADEDGAVRRVGLVEGGLERRGVVLVVVRDGAEGRGVDDGMVRERARDRLLAPAIAGIREVGQVMLGLTLSRQDVGRPAV